MNRKKLLISTLFITSVMLNLMIIPAIAKPNIVTVVIKYSDGTPYDSYFTLVNVNKNQYTPSIYVDSRGKANVEIPSNWAAGDLLEVRKYSSAPTWGYGELSKNLSDRIVIKNLPPPG